MKNRITDINEKKISIIIPVYNGEKNIVKCVESVLNQSYKNTEIIIINDGSTDNTIKILNYYKALNSNICVIDKKNEGVSSARNDGIKISSGDYILFVDADDTLEHNAVEVLLEIMVNKNVELVIASNNILRRKRIIRENILTDKLYDKREMVEKITKRNIFLSTPWGKLFDSNIIKSKNILFNTNLEIAEDTLFNLEYLSCINNIYVCSNIVYNYVVGGVASSSKYHKNIYQSYYLLLSKYIELNTKSNEQLILQRAENFLNVIIDHYCIFCSRKDAITNIQKAFDIFSEIKEVNLLFKGKSIRNLNKSDIVKYIYKDYYFKNYIHIIYRRILINIRNIIRI